MLNLSRVLIPEDFSVWSELQWDQEDIAHFKMLPRLLNMQRLITTHLSHKLKHNTKLLSTRMNDKCFLQAHLILACQHASVGHSVAMKTKHVYEYTGTEGFVY